MSKEQGGRIKKYLCLCTMGRRKMDNGGKRGKRRKRDAWEADTILEVGRQTAVPDLRPGGKSEIAPRDVSPNPLPLPSNTRVAAEGVREDVGHDRDGGGRVKGLMHVHNSCRNAVRCTTGSTRDPPRSYHLAICVVTPSRAIRDTRRGASCLDTDTPVHSSRFLPTNCYLFSGNVNWLTFSGSSEGSAELGLSTPLRFYLNFWWVDGVVLR